MKKCFLLLTTLFLSVFAIPSYADEQDNQVLPEANKKDKSPISGTFAITSNYLSEGISNSNNKPAFQGGLTYTFLKTGIYFNIWGSNVDFIELQGKRANIEIDTVAGISNDINDHFSYNIYIDRYNYPKASEENYTDYIISLTYRIFTATIQHSFNIYGSHKSGTYYNGAINYDIPKKYIRFTGITAMASLGHYNIPRSIGLYSFTDYMLGLKKTIGNYSITLQWSNTNNAHLPPLDGSHVVATLEYDF